MTAITHTRPGVGDQNQHVCLIYDDPRDQLPTLLPFLQNGLRAGEQCIYIVDDIEGELLRSELRKGGLDVARAENEGSLLLWTRAEWRQPGRLESARKSAQVASILKRARAAGFAGVRLAVEMTWTLNPRIPVERLRHWEATLDMMIAPGESVSVFCQYSRLRLAPATIEAGLSTHPLAMVGGELYDNPYFAGPAILSAEGRPPTAAVRSTQLARMISHLRRPQKVANRRPGLHGSAGNEPFPLEPFAEAAPAASTRSEAINLISHELRTPLSTILGNAELLARLNGGLPEGERVASVTAILDESRRLSDVFDDLFVLWHDVAPPSLVLEPIALRHAIERSVAVHRNRHPERAVTFAADASERTVTADLSYFAQILSNLLENAERSSPPAGHILVETALEGDYMVVRVVDQGADIGTAERDLIFTAFVPPGAGLRRGSGPALAASKRLVEAHGGHIWTQPGASGGTEFGFALPVAGEGGRDGQ